MKNVSKMLFKGVNAFKWLVYRLGWFWIFVPYLEHKFETRMFKDFHFLTIRRRKCGEDIRMPEPVLMHVSKALKRSRETFIGFLKTMEPLRLGWRKIQCNERNTNDGKETLTIEHALRIDDWLTDAHGLNMAKLLCLVYVIKWLITIDLLIKFMQGVCLIRHNLAVFNQPGIKTYWTTKITSIDDFFSKYYLW